VQLNFLLFNIVFHLYSTTQYFLSGVFDFGPPSKKISNKQLPQRNDDKDKNFKQLS
jgi:hypothetical protein